ncbi:Protein pim1 [Symbiodinium microadriaticum]|uniref:Protein pim1 n=1 Tax=Symbiodinium microadriaticum TaxID=2951 RepID=A0A1Q9E4C9_SYMMI|nr:Protein pim1 [Symbiodinium microadriaticum]
MAIAVEVGLISGKTATVQAALDETVETLKRRAQTALGVGKGRLLDSMGDVLDGCMLIKTARLQNGDLLTLHIRKVQVTACCHAFAAILGDGSAVTWGHAECGGDSSVVQNQLKDVQQIQASFSAFAAILGDGSVVTWGKAFYGSDSSAVQDQLKNVQQIQASDAHFAAVLSDGSVVTWGEPSYEDDSSVCDQLKDVRQIQASDGAFAAILGDGTVVTWGNDGHGGDSTSVQDQLKNVQQIQASGGAFAAILGDGSVVTWGHDESGGDSATVQDQLKNVQQIQASGHSFAAVLGDGSVVTWGKAMYGGDCGSIQSQLKNVQQISGSRGAFAAILGDGSVVTWGSELYGVDTSPVQDQLKNVQQIEASIGAFAAILGNGSVVTWGKAFYGSDSTAVQDQLKNVQQIQASGHAFAAILGDGSVVTWGNAGYGGDSTSVQDQLQNSEEDVMFSISTLVTTLFLEFLAMDPPGHGWVRNRMPPGKRLRATLANYNGDYRYYLGDGPEAYRAWRRRLIPDALALMQLDKRDAILAGQRFIHPRLGGVSRRPERQPAETAARLLIAFAGARQVTMDVELLDALCAPLQDALERWLSGEREDDAGMLPLAPETIADALSAVVSCGVRPQRLHHLFVDCILREEVSAWERCDVADLCTIASTVSLLCDDSKVFKYRFPGSSKE